jgi:hypothetical protein
MANIPPYAHRDFSVLMKERTIIDYPSVEDMIEWMRDNLKPEQVFSEGDLDHWATENGFSKPEED